MPFARRSAWLLLALLANPAPAAAPPVRRLDLYGDPLPAGAVARLGTLRWRQLDGVSRLAFSADGRFFVGGGFDSVTIWDARTGQILRTIHDPDGGQASPLARIGLLSTGKVLLTRVCHLGSTLIWWDLSSGIRLARLEEAEHALDVIAISPKGEAAAAGGRGLLTGRGCILLLFDRPAEKPIHRLSFSRDILRALAYSADGKSITGLFQASDQYLVRRMEVSTGRIEWTTPLRKGLWAALSRDGSRVAVYDEAGELSIWSTGTGKNKSLGTGRGLAGHELLFADDDRVLLGYERSRPLVRRYDTWTGEELAPVRIGADLAHHLVEPALSPDGKTLALSHGQGSVALVEIATGNHQNAIPGITQATALLSFSADGQFMTTVTESDGLLRWDPSSGRQLFRAAASRADALLRKTGVLSHSGERIIEAKWRTVEVHDVLSGKRVESWPVPEKAVGKLAISPDDKTLALLGKDGILRFWQLPGGKRLGEAQPERRVRETPELVFSPDGRLLATVNGPDWVELWQVPSGLPAGKMYARRDRFILKAGSWQGCFSTDGRKLYSAFPTLLQTWDVGEHQELPALMREQGPVNAAAAGPVALSISADGRFLARVDGQSRMSLLETASGQVIYRHCGLWGTVAFAPTRWRLAAEDRRSLTIPILDLPSVFLSLPSLRPNGSSTQSLWADLAHADAARAQQAAWELARLDGVEAFLGQKLSPVPPAVGERVAALIKALGSDEFSARQKAEEELVGMRDSARKALETAVQHEKDIEVKYRLRRLLGLISSPSPRLLQEHRAVMVLEARGTPAARQLLRRLAAGLPGARLTEEAAAALRRLESPSEKRSR
jgi:WD40 repeat protein